VKTRGVVPLTSWQSLSQEKSIWGRVSRLVVYGHSTVCVQAKQKE
jgi:hypothetical protein